jgi:hypothetical protein
VSVLRRVGTWVARHQLALVYVALMGVFVLGLSLMTELRRGDARVEREAALRFCNDSNERTTVIRDFMLAATAEPNPAQYDFIVDPVLRAGVLDQARRARADMRERVAGTFLPRDCAGEFPSPP